MPIIKNRTIFEIAQGIKAFLNWGQIAEKDKELANLRKELNQKLKHYQRQIARRDKKLVRLQKELAQTQSVGYPLSSSGENPPLFFLVGRAKSGTSWLMNLLNAHPEIMCTGEGKFFGKESLRSLHGSLKGCEKLQTWLTNNPWSCFIDTDPDLEEILGNTVSFLMKHKLGRAVEHKPKLRIIGDKTPFLTEGVIHEIASALPDSKVIHIIRDGRDVAVSSIHFTWNHASDIGGPFHLTPEQVAKRESYRANPERFGPGRESIFSAGWAANVAKEWRDTVGRAIKDGPNLLGNNYLEVRYEYLLAQPVKEMRGLMEFLGADPSEEVIEECIETASFERMSKRDRGKEDSTSFYRKGVSGDWRSIFTEEDRQAFKEVAGELLIKLGYEKDCDW